MQHQEAMMTLKGKIAIVTGSTSGIGLGIAEALAKAGAEVIINSFSDTDADHAVAAKIAAEHKVKVTYISADMSKAADCRALVEKAGGCDILVNNAGIQHVEPIETFPTAKWDAIIAINLTSAFHTTAVALPMMRKKGWGRVINISSAHGLRASPFKSAYVSAKHGLVGLSKTVALETAGQGITCNAICPGYVLTPLVEAQIPDQMNVHNMDIKAVCHNRRTGRHGGFLVLGPCRPDHRNRNQCRWWLDGDVTPRRPPNYFGTDDVRGNI
jgi:3-hydroxybutyrate dehydrogenase